MQHAVQGGLEAWTAPFTNMPPGMTSVEVERVYGLSVFIATTDSSIMGYRIQATITFEQGAVVSIDELWPANLYNGYCWARLAVGSKTPPVKLSGLILTPVVARPSVTIPLL